MCSCATMLSSSVIVETILGLRLEPSPATGSDCKFDAQIHGAGRGKGDTETQAGVNTRLQTTAFPS